MMNEGGYLTKCKCTHCNEMAYFVCCYYCMADGHELGLSLKSLNN